MCIEVGFEREVSNDIQRSYDAGLEMATADFFHCENIPDDVVKSYWIKKMLQWQGWLGRALRFQTGGK